MIKPRAFLSASTQEHNLGKVAGYIEETVCQMVARAASLVLERHGVETMLSDIDEDYIDHTNRSNKWLTVEHRDQKKAAHVAIHTNAATDPKAEGLHAGCFDPKNEARESTILTKTLFSELAPVLPSDKDKIVRYRFFEVVNTLAPCAYLELLFHTNIMEARWLMDNIDAAGLALAKGILKYFKIPYVEIDPTRYIVQAGVFRSLKNAENLASRLCAAGFNAIVKRSDVK